MLKKRTHIKVTIEQKGIGSLSKQEAKKFEIEMLEKEILDLKGESRDQAIKSYHKLLKFQDEPLYLKRNDE